jgi:hypothetical protein
VGPVQAGSWGLVEAWETLGQSPSWVFDRMAVRLDTL